MLPKMNKLMVPGLDMLTNLTQEFNLAIVCGQYCKTCDTNNQKCATCIDGQSPLDDTDFKCTLKCQTGHKSCQLIESVYSFTECNYGYELLNGQCIECPNNCKKCQQGVCSECLWPYSIKNSLCFEDRNCIKYRYLELFYLYDYVYDSEGTPIDTNCQQCDPGYFKKGTRCSACQDEPGLEKCFICNNGNECKGCFATHYLTSEKKCAPYTTNIIAEKNKFRIHYFQFKFLFKNKDFKQSFKLNKQEKEVQISKYFIKFNVKNYRNCDLLYK